MGLGLGLVAMGLGLGLECVRLCGLSWPHPLTLASSVAYCRGPVIGQANKQRVAADLLQRQ